MGKSSNRSAEYFFTGKYEDDNDGNDITAINLYMGGVINAYGGNDHIVIASLSATVNTTWGNDTIEGGAGYLFVNKTHNGSVEFTGAAGGLEINHTGDNGNIDYTGGSGYNNIVRKGVQGDIRFEGGGFYNSLYSDVTHGDIHFTGAGGYNKITRKGAGNDFSGKGLEYAKAEEIILREATMNGSWIGSDHQVSGIKSAQEPNTYLFAFADNDHTKINKVQLRNDPETGRLKYYTTSWYKAGKHLNDLEKQDISGQGGFVAVNQDGAYTLSNLNVERQQAVTQHAVEKKLTENAWVTYGDGALVKASDITLSDAKMGGDAIYRDGTTVDVQAVKSNRMMPNTYVYAKKLGIHTKIVVVELRNDPKTGVLQYLARPWYKEGDHTANLANEVISYSNGYHDMGTGSYSLSDLHYSTNVVLSASARVANMHEYSESDLFGSAEGGNKESSGDVHFNGAGGGNVIQSNVTRGNVYFNGAGIANIIEHSSAFGNTKFNGAGGANVIIKKGKEGNLSFDGVGIANVLLHQSQRGDMNVNAGGAANVLVRIGDGRYLAHLLAVGNISIHKGHGNSRISMGGGFNTHTQIGNGDAFWSGVGGANVLTQMGNGNVSSILVGGVNVLTKVGEGNLESAMFGGANVITHISNNHSSSDTKAFNTKAIALGGANVLTKKGRGDVQAVMGGGANVLTHVGDGKTTGIMLGGANILTKVGNGDTTGIMLGLGNVLTHVGDGQTLGIMGAAGNIFTKVGDGTTIAAMVGAGNIFTHVGEENAWALMGGAGNIFTKVGNGDALALMLAFGNVFTHVGDGMSVALMIAKGNVATKVGNGDALSAMIGKGNIFTQIGHGSTFAAMIGGANVLTKVGDDLTAALMIGEANIYTHVGKGTSIGLFGGSANIMTKVGDGTTLAAMFGKANIMTHVGDGLTGVLALGKANIVTKVGNDFMGVVAASEANVITHVGDGTTATLLSGKGNILTKVGDGTTVGLLISKIGNIMTHLGDGTTVGFVKGEANIITKVGDGLGINAAWGKANVLTHVGDGDRYNFAKGEANIITKIGDGQEVTVVQGQANIVTHVGNGDDYTGAWGKANVITKVGNGRNVVLAKGEANIVTQIGNGDSFNALWSQGNIVTKVGDGIQVTAAKGKGNITTTVGDGLSVTATHGDLNINTKVGDGVSVNVAWGKFNVNTKVGDGLNVSVMKGKGNANIHVGDGLNVHASYARNNVAIQVGNGDFYNLSVAESNTESNKLDTLFSNIKQTLLGVAGSQGINYLVNGDEANTSGTHKGRGAIDLPEISSLNGFKLTEIDEITSDLKGSLKGSVTGVDAPDIGSIENALGNEKRLNPNQSRNLIINGDFEQGDKGWQHTNGIEASHSAKSYGLSVEGHGERVSELDVQNNTSIYQDIRNLTAGESIKLSFDFARRTKSSNDNGMRVLWNKKLVFSDYAGEAKWQSHTLTLTAQAGSNRLEFVGTGKSDGFGYILDNIVAKSELSDSGIADHMKQDKAAQNALQDKARAETDRQRLVQERDKHQASISATQAQLENTDLDALNANGQTQRNAIQDEAQAETDELQAKVKGLEALNSHAIYHGESGEQSRDRFAHGLLKSVQTELDKADETVRNQLDNAQKAAAGRLGDIKDAVAKSEAGKLKGEQNQQHAEQDIEKARLQAENRRKEALNHEQRANQAGSDGKSAALKAEQRGQNEASAADSKTAQVQNDAKNSKLDGSYKPKRTGATGSGLSGKAYESNYSEHIEKAEQSKSSINPESTVQANGGFSEKLQHLDENLNELADAKKALDRLQINAGIRVKKSILTSGHREMSVHQPVSQPADGVTEWARSTPKISGLDLSGLQALGEPHGQPESADGSERASSTTVRARAQKVADIYRWLDKGHSWNKDNGIAIDKYIPVPGFDRIDTDISNDVRQEMIDNIKEYINNPKNKNSVPKEQVASLAELFVNATIDYDWNKRVEFISMLERYGYSFEPAYGDKSIVSFWSGKNRKGYREALDSSNPDGKKVVYDTSIKGNSFALELNRRLISWGMQSDTAKKHDLLSVVRASAYSNTGFWSSLYATGARNDVYVMSEGGIRLGNYFWNVELPVLRQLQREGLVGEIRLLDKPASEYQGVSPESIGRRLTDAGVSVKARFDSFSSDEQKRLEELNPGEYQPATLIDLNITTSAIDSLLNKALPFYSLRTERNLLVRKSEDDSGFEVRPWPDNNGDAFKKIIVEGSEGLAQIKSIERFILANYDNYDQLPDALNLVDDRIVSHDQGRAYIVAKKVEGSWSYKPKAEPISAAELPFYDLREERNLLVRKSKDYSGFEVCPWLNNNGDAFKKIIVEDSEEPAQIKAIERFILANYDNYDQLPEALHLVDDRIVSHDQGRTRIVAQKVEGSWSYKPKAELISASELQEAAYVKGKILGDSYRNVLDALKGYENTLQNSKDYDLYAIEKLTYLHHQVEGYLLGHPDSARIPVLKNLLSQINVRMEESLILAEPTLESAGKGNFSELYNKLGNAKLKDSKHLYLDEQGDFVTRGKSNIQTGIKAESAEKAVEQIKAAVTREYGQSVTDAVFANLNTRDLAKDGKGIDVSGLKKVHHAIEQQLSPVSATLFVWKPSDHSSLGHAALQIGQGRTQISAENAGEFNEKNYVSWWPKGSKSSDIRNIFNVSSERYPDMRLRWRDLSQPARQHTLLQTDVAFEEGDKFGMQDGSYKLAKFNKELEVAKEGYARFADFSENTAITMLENPRFLQSAGIPESISRSFVERVEAGGADVFELGKEFAEALRTAAKQQHTPELAEEHTANIIRQFAEHELSDIQDFKTSEADQGRVFRINLAGLDAAAMQAEWQKISQNPDARYQLLNGNCSSIVARVLKAGGADKVIGHTWQPKFGVWTPTELFNFAQKLQEVQLETVAKKQHYSPVEELAALSGKNKTLETVIAENDGTPSLNELITKDGLRKKASVFAKPIGPSYQTILDKLDHIHNLTGNEQLSAGFELYQHITRYLNEHPDSKRNTALSGVQTQLGDIMFRGALQEVRSPLLEIAQTRPEMALRIYQIARNEARGDTPGLTDLMVRWVKEDPYLAAKLGYQGEVPTDLAFNPKFHVDLGDQFDDFKQCLSKAQDKGLLINARIDEQNKRVHLGYSYNELLDMTGSENVKMAVYFLKEVAKQADPNFAGSHEAILLNRFANPAYLVQLEQGRLAQIEAIYHSSHQTDITAWDKQYSSDALTQLNRQLSDGTDLNSQLSLLLKDRQGLLIGESHGSDLNGLRFVNEQMDALKTHGVTVIGLEHLRSDLAQPLIDKFLAGGDMPAELTAMIETKHLSVDLFEQAKSKGIKIIALDDNSTTRPVIEGSQHGLMYRAGAANNVAVKRLGQLAEGEKFVAIYGDAHLQSHEGIDHFVPGMTHRLGLPALKVDANNRFTAQADDISLRKHYDDVPQLEKNLYKPNRVVGGDLEALGHSDESEVLKGTKSVLKRYLEVLKPEENHIHVNNHDVGSWENITVKPQPESGDSRFSGQIIIQTENDSVAAKAAANLAGKHPDSSVIVQLDANGQYRVVYGNPDKLQSGKLRWQIVGHGREESAQNHTRISGYSADELALRLKQFSTDFKQADTPDHISLVGCSLIGDDKRNGFARRFISALGEQGVRTTVSARSSEVAVDSIGRKYTKDAQDQWVHKLTDNKIVLGWNDKGEVESHSERVRRGISENDITLSRVGHTAVDAKAQGAIADNVETFHAPKKRNENDENNLATSSKSNKQLSYSGNIQVHLGDGEFTTINWGTSNLGIKVGIGGFKSLAFGDNNVMVHFGDGNSKHSVNIAGYQALEGAQLFVGNRNISFNLGRSNDLIVMLDKSIPTPPLVNPFDGAARISGVLQNIAGSYDSPDWLTAQNQQWTLESAKKYVSDLSGLDLTSSVDYETLTDLDSQNERSSRGLKSDLESTLNKKYNQWLGKSGNTPDMGKISRADKFRQANEKLAFNFAVGGQGADIQVTTGNWNFMFGDNIQSILDTNLGSLFGLMTQEYTSTGMAKTTFTFSPKDLPRQIKNKLLGNLAGVSADTTLADIFGVDYTQNGGIVSRSGQPIGGTEAIAILREMLEIIGEFSGSQLQAFTDPAKLLDSLKAGLKTGADGVKSFAKSHGLKAAAPDENQEGHVSINEKNKPVSTTEELQADRALGLNSLNLPNLFATLFSKNKQTEMKSLVTNLKENLTADLLNIQDKTFDFLRNSGHLQGDGDINVSLGNYNFNWGGDGKDLGAYLGDNNNFWGGRGDDVFYSVGTSNIFTGGEGNDVGVLMGRENMMSGGAGNDVAVLAGRTNYAFMGDGDDQIFVFGEGGVIHGNKGRDYIVASGNFNHISAGEGQDYVVTIGNNNQADLGEGNDFATVFGNYNRIDGNSGNNSIKLMGYHAVINGGTGNDHLIADVVSKFSQFNGGDGDDLLVLGGYQNRFKGGSGVNSFVVSGDVIDNVVEDIKQSDKIVFNDINWQNLWFQRSGYDLVLLTHRNIKDTSAQGQFEAMGSVTFNNYFNGNRADLITQMGDKDIQGERGYTSLSANAVDSLVQAMSGFAPKMGDSGFIDSLDSQMKSTIVTAWSDTTNGKSKLV